MAEPASFAFGAARVWPRSERRAEPRPAQPARCQGSAARQALTVFFVRSRQRRAPLPQPDRAGARWMGANDYGVYVLVWTWVLVLGNLCNLGLSTAVVRLVPQHRARGEDAALRGLFFARRLLVVAVASGIALISFGVLWCLGEQVATPYLVPALLGLICLPILTLIDIQDGMARARGLMALGLLPPYMLRPLLLLGLLATAHAAAHPVTARSGIGAAILASLGAVIVQSLLLRRHLQRNLPRGPPWPDYRNCTFRARAAMRWRIG